MKKQICILGSTGSIGTQALEVISQQKDRYEVYCLTANDNIQKLAEQARKYRPATVITANESLHQTLRELLQDLPEIKVYAGAEAIEDIVQATPIDIILTAMVGFAGLRPTIKAIEAGKKIALANKETLVVAGQLITDLATRYHAPIIPVDSEHSAIFQSLAGEGDNDIEKIILTASGGPFRKMEAKELKNVTAHDALKHPTWTMGPKITIDSATMMNKGLEVIEAKWLFGVPTDKIQVLIHPQSIIHSAVQFSDGAVKAQLGTPDMKLPIAYAFSYPDRPLLQTPRLDLTQKPLEFHEPDLQKFPCLALAYHAINRGGNLPCAMNAANEVVNEAFRQGLCDWHDFEEVISQVMEQTQYTEEANLETYIQTDIEARKMAEELLKNKRPS